MADEEQQAIVVLVPGLWMPAWVMIPLALRLGSAGHRCVRFGYASHRATLEANAIRLAAFVRRQGQARIHLVGHSLGGALALHATARHGLSQVRRIVLAGSPFSDSFVARKLARLPLGRRLLGNTVPQWLACEKPGVPRGVEVGVIAGTRGLGLGMLVAPEMPRPHDGVIGVAETRVQGMAAYVEVAVNHANMLVSVQVARLVSVFLRSGRFDNAVAQARIAGQAEGYAVDRRRDS